MVGVQETLAHLRRIEDARRRAGADRASGLLARLPGAVELLRGRGAVRVVLFGSLAAGVPTSESDVDLAVAGLPAATYFDTLAELESLFGAPVDLVRVEEAPESLRQRIAEEGREL